ncbi:MAG: TMEM175 family protein [Gordonia sp. (in: high G+C Gram-positive bacteria)]|uniref:TMEM175 family protein n=1 Tax=Gordonia sp. (in: high G+C Gram-positive bacteria) TaxID=84139 RepID=UPI0039E39B0B
MDDDSDPAAGTVSGDDRRTTEGLRRLIAFTDAIVAIALTLLVLPLTDLASDAPEETGLGAFLSDHLSILVSFVVSFTVIWALWRQHHRLIEYFRCYDGPLSRLHFVWLFTVVLMPFSTALIGSSSMAAANTLYIANLWVSVAALGLMQHHGLRRPALLEPGRPRRELAAAGIDYAPIVLLTVALVITAIRPSVGQWPLLLLLLAIPLGIRRTRRHAAAS